MTEYYYISHKDQCLRNSIWKVYGKKCFYCGRMLDLNTLEVDHIIPVKRENLVSNDENEALEKYIGDIEKDGFKTHCIQNYLPNCGHCNKQKNNDFFTVGNLRYFLDYAIKKQNKVIQEIEKLRYKKPAEEEGKQKDELIQRRQKEKDLIVDKQIIEGFNDSYYINGLGKVRLDAFLPVDFKSKLSCLIMFEQEGISDCMFSFDEEQIHSLFFEGYNTGISSERNFIWYINNKEIALKFPYNRFVTDEETVKQLCELTDDLYREFYKRKGQLVNTVGGRLFEEEEAGLFKMITLPRWIWLKMFNFAQSHDHAYGDGIWDTFYPINPMSENRIVIYKNHKIDVEADVLVELIIRNAGYDNVDVIWKPGDTPHIYHKMEGFNNVQKWTVEYTYDWIINEFLPHIFYIEELEQENLLKKVFLKKQKYEIFKKTFDIRKYNIISCKMDGTDE